jgi:hypothetical protein
VKEFFKTVNTVKENPPHPNEQGNISEEIWIQKRIAE